MCTVQARRPVQAPLHEARCHPACGCATSWTVLPCANACAQRPGQATPAPPLETVPRPVRETTSWCVVSANCACTWRACDILTTHGLRPVQAPLHDANTWFGAGCGTSVTFASNSC